MIRQLFAMAFHMAKLYNGEVGTAKDRVAEAASYFQENYKTLLGTNG